MQTARTVEQAVILANGVAYGLVASVHGRDVGDLMAVARSVRSGLVKVNAPTTGVDFWAPFGGEKASSYGPREQGTAALAFYSSTRTITWAPHPVPDAAVAAGAGAAAVRSEDLHTDPVVPPRRRPR